MKLVALQRLWYDRLTLEKVFYSFDIQSIITTREVSELRQLLETEELAYVFIDEEWQDDITLLQTVYALQPKAKIILTIARGAEIPSVPSTMIDNVFVLCKPYTEEKMKKLLQF